MARTGEKLNQLEDAAASSWSGSGWIMVSTQLLFRSKTCYKRTSSGVFLCTLYRAHHRTITIWFSILPNHKVPYYPHPFSANLEIWEMKLRRIVGSTKCRLPIYTLRVLNSKIYVVTSIDLVNAINRNSKILAFNPFIAQLGKRITGHDETTSRIVQHNLNGENGPGYVTEIHDNTVSALAPGEALERMTNAMLLEASLCLQALENENVIDLFAWIRHMVTLCSTRAIYGSENPFNRDQGRLIKAFWYVLRSCGGNPRYIITIMPGTSTRI